MIDKIRHLRSQPRTVLILCRDDRLRGFLADLLEYLVEAVVEEIRSLRAFRSIALTALDQLVKRREQDTEFFVLRL